MTPYHKRVTAFTKPMAEDMQLRNLSPRTIDAYTYHVDRFALRFGKHPEELGPDEIREFQLWMINELKSSWIQFNQAVCALRFFYTVTAKRDWVVKQIPYGQRPKKLPVVLSGDEVSRIIACITNIKHRTVLLTLYSAGLRIAEGLQLKVSDIDSQRMMLKVTQGKGAKDRYVPISPRLLTALRLYWKECRPSDYLFPGRTDDTPLNKAVVQKACSLATAQAKINKHVTPHTMRHSYATGLLEAGVDLMAISKLLGHSSFLTTMVYLHCRRQHFENSPSPIDWLPVRQCPKWIDPTFRSDAPPETSTRT
ncbi:tyrosine-type recombinase/integrase [Pirellulaceae bacterium SH449]